MARMKVRILEDKGIYKKGQEVEMARAQGEQWENSGFAEYVLPAAEPNATPKVDSLYSGLSGKELSAELKDRDLSTKGNIKEKIARLEEDDAKEEKQDE